MKRTLQTTILMLLILSFSVIVLSVPLRGAAPSDIVFSDHFDGTTVDTTKWLVQENTNMSGLPAFGGSVTVANSRVFLTSTDDGTSFPCVTNAFNPFPSSGDFAIEFDLRYTCISDWGSGLWISNGPFIVNGSQLTPIFQIWAGGGYTQTSVDVYLLGGKIYQDFYGWEEGSDTHLFRIEYLKGVYRVFVDSVEVANASSQLRPDTIGFGHPPASYVPFTHERAFGNSGTWCSFKIGFINVWAVQENSGGTTPTPTPTSTPTPTPTPTPGPTLPTPTLVVTCAGSASYSGFNVQIIGSLTFNGTGISEAPLLLSYSVTGGKSWIDLTLVNTGSDGSYLVAWMPSVTGNYLLKAVYGGNEICSNTSTIVNLAVTPFAEQSVFSATSNSTITEFSFNSTSRELRFGVSGPSGTTGYVNAYIPTSLIGNISSLEVYLDGNQTEYAVAFASQSDSWFLYFTYQHSTHAVIINLGSSVQTNENSLANWMLYLIPAVFAVIIIAVVLALKRTKLHKSQTIQD
jgi:hypothetical protein